jgi:hypothetical protein
MDRSPACRHGHRQGHVVTTWTVYKHVSHANRVLYVGCTSNLDKRTAAHSAASPWFSDVAEVVPVEQHTDRPAALAAELALIGELCPPYNTTGTGRHVRKVWRDGPADEPAVIPPLPELYAAQWLIVRTGRTQHALAVDGATTECGMRLDWRRAWRGPLDDGTPRCQLCERHVLARRRAS